VPASVNADDDTPHDAVLDALWDRALGAWDDEKIHSALLDHALRSSALPEIAGRYRALLEDPARGAIAKKRIDAIVVAASSMLLSTKTPRPDRPVPIAITLSALGICVVLLGWVALALWGQHSR
jgi:hypothetical protein